MESYQKGISIKADYPKLQRKLGITYHNMGRNEEAVAAYKIAIGQKPDDYEAFPKLGDAYEGMKQLRHRRIW